MPENFNIQNVLIAPLDWGLGHATRCVPLIHAFIKKGYRVFIAADGPQEVLLRKEFPQISFIKLPGYQVRYSRSKGWLPFKIIQQLPRLLQVVKREHKWVEEVVEHYGIDLVISDNRYGLWTNKCLCVFITHQLNIQAPYVWLERLIRRINYSYVNRFNACWVPDVEAEGGIGGRLSHPDILPRVPVKYMGLLSRFHSLDIQEENQLTILLSGPEPQRTLLEETIINQLNEVQHQVILIRGLPSETTKPIVPTHVQVFNHLDTHTLSKYLQQSRWVIARSGYSSVMDFLQLKRKTILIPTPGQTEQEYLAERLQEKNWALKAAALKFNIAAALNRASQFYYHHPQMESFNDNKIEELLAATTMTVKSKM